MSRYFRMHDRFRMQGAFWEWPGGCKVTYVRKDGKQQIDETFNKCDIGKEIARSLSTGTFVEITQEEAEARLQV